MAVREHNAALRNPEVAYEASDVSPRPVFLVGAGIAAATVICGLIALGLLAWDFRVYARQPSVAPPIGRGTRTSTPEPTLQKSPRLDFEQYRAKQRAFLESSGWVDRAKGIAHIPIRDAMQLLVERGIPPQLTPEDLQLTTPEAGSRLTGFEDRVTKEAR